MMMAGKVTGAISTTRRASQQIKQQDQRHRPQHPQQPGDQIDGCALSGGRSSEPLLIHGDVQLPQGGFHDVNGPGNDPLVQLREEDVDQHAPRKLAAATAAAR